MYILSLIRVYIDYFKMLTSKETRQEYTYYRVKVHIQNIYYLGQTVHLLQIYEYMAS